MPLGATFFANVGFFARRERHKGKKIQQQSRFVYKRTSDRILRGWISPVINPWGGITTVCIVCTNNRRQYIRKKMANISAKFSDTRGNFYIRPGVLFIAQRAPHYRHPIHHPAPKGRHISRKYCRYLRASPRYKYAFYSWTVKNEISGLDTVEGTASDLPVRCSCEFSGNVLFRGRP